MKKAAIMVAIVILAPVAIITCDYFTLFGVRENTITTLADINFQAVDGKTGSLINDVTASCFNLGSRNVCSQRDSYKFGTVTIQIPSQQLVTSSYFFEKNREFIFHDSAFINIIFFHPSYLSVRKKFTLKTLFDNNSHGNIVKLESREG